jgi:hypothetical protein
MFCKCISIKKHFAPSTILMRQLEGTINLLTSIRLLFCVFVICSNVTNVMLWFFVWFRFIVVGVVCVCVRKTEKK